MAESSETTEKWRYVIALGKFVVHMIYPGMTKAISVLVPAMVFQFQMNYTTVGFLVPMQLGVVYIACPLSNYLATKFGHRCVSSVGGFLSGVSLMGAFFSQSALSLGFSFFFTGLFSSPLYQSSTVILREHYGEKYGMAITFTQMGGQIGGIIFPYTAALCLEAYGMRGAMLCLSGIFFYQTAIGATFRAPRSPAVKKKKRHNCGQDDIEGSTLLQGQEDETYNLQKNKLRTDVESLNTDEGTSDESRIRKDTESQKSNPTGNSIAEVLSSICPLGLFRKELVFTFIFIPCQIILEGCFAIWITFSSSYGVSVGLHENEAVYLPMIGSLGGIISRLVLLRILYKYPHLAPHAFAVNTGVSSMALLAHPISSSLVHFLICSFFVGFGIYGSTSSLYAYLAIKIKKENFPLAMATTFMTSGVILLISATLAGNFFERIRSFKTIFIAAGVVLLINLGVFSGFLFVDTFLKRRSSTENK